jgi:hypothetical protein
VQRRKGEENLPLPRRPAFSFYGQIRVLGEEDRLSFGKVSGKDGMLAEVPRE